MKILRAPRQPTQRLADLEAPNDDLEARRESALLDGSH
jgi:hypothetical protein